MAGDGVKFTPGAAGKIAKAVKQVLARPGDNRGPRTPSRTVLPTIFKAKITGYTGTFGAAPLHYSWQEEMENASSLPGWQDNTAGGRTGTTTTNYALNDYEVNGGQWTQPISNGTVVQMTLTFDNGGTPYYRFNLCQLPTLSTYQGWYGTAAPGGSVITIQNDFLRCT